jgi:two-component system nitrogen regulation sensor histidine kinase GlnL
MERRRMTSAAEHRRPVPADAEIILNALPNPVLLVAPDGRIVDANMAAESVIEGTGAFRKSVAVADRPGSLERLAGQ